MSRTTLILAIIYFLLVEALIIAYSPAGGALFIPAAKRPALKPCELPVPPAFNYLGEEIVYDVKMGSIRIGTAVFHHRQQAQRDGIDAQEIVFTTRVVQLNDTETIWADTKEFLPLHVERDVRMWPKYERIIESYDQVKHTLDIAKTSGGRQETMRISRQGPIHNAILLPYQLRRVERLAPGWSMAVTLPTQEFKITLVSIEDVEVPAGTFKAFYLESDPKRFAIWISADDRRIPVKIRGSGGVNYTMLMRSYRK